VNDDTNGATPNDDATPGHGMRRRGGRPPGSGGGGGRGRRPASRAPEPRGDFTPQPRVATPEPESVRPARELLEQLLLKMGVPEARVRYYARSEGEYLEVDGPDLANLIGRHGHTLEALNLIFNNIVNAGVRSNRHYFTIDAEGYRARRADMLKALALQTLERAMREKRPIALEPMLPSERKVVHLALADNPFVSTESTGVEPERRVVVSPRPQ
jgi:spoIIIJ-associated protein